MSHFCPRCCLSVVCCYFCENKIVRELVRESDSRFLCRCSGCCHDTGGGCSVCACLCAYVRVCVCMPVCTPHEASFGSHPPGCGLLFD